MNQMPKLTIPVLLLLVLCTALSGASADSVAIKAEDGADLPAIVSVGETFTVMITDGGNHVGAGTNVVFTLPASGGDQIYTITDSNGKAWYKPTTTGALKVKVLDGIVTVAEATVAVGSTEQILVDGDNFTGPPICDGASVINMSGEFDNDVAGGNIDVTTVTDPEAAEAAAGAYAFTGDGQMLLGLDVSPDTNVTAELANGGDTITIKICYDEAELESLNIDPATLAIWRHDGITWVKMVNGTPPCIGNGRDGTCVWVELNNLSLFTLVGSFFDDDTDDGTSSGSGEGTYPPGWYETPTPVPTTTATAEPTEPEQSDESEATDESTTGDADETVTTGTDGEGDAATAGEEIPTTELKAKGIPGFESVFVIAGLLAAMYLVLRRRD